MAGPQDQPDPAVPAHPPPLARAYREHADADGLARPFAAASTWPHRTRGPQGPNGRPPQGATGHGRGHRGACHDGAVTWTAPEVTRYYGPQPEGERATLRQFLDFQRATLLLKCAGLTGAQLAERNLPPSELSLLGLIRHLTNVERIWFRQRFADEPVEDAYEVQVAFEATDPTRAAADYARLTEEIKLADAAAENSPLEATFTHHGEALTLRFIYLHMIEEYARHNGHADLLRERNDGATGE